jgi:HEAT repeat protein
LICENLVLKWGDFVELLVLYSIIGFAIIIFFLFFYLIFKKIHEKIRERMKKKYLMEVNAYIDNLIAMLDIENSYEMEINKIRNIMKDKIRREIIEERIIYHFGKIEKDKRLKLSKLCEDIGLVEYEIKRLKNKNIHQVALACKNLGEFRSKKAIQPLLNLVPHPSTDIKYNALLALAKIGDETAFLESFRKLSETIPLSERSLIEIADSFEGDKLYIYKTLIHSEDDFISSIFIKSAGNHREAALVDDIALFLNSSNKEKRLAALKALGNIGDNKYVDIIIELLNDKEWEVRAMAAKALGQIKDSRALLPLVKALSDPQWYVRYNSAYSLVSIEGGLDMVKLVLQGNDRFAKDIIIAVLETTYGLNKLIEYDLIDNKSPRLLDLLEDYVAKRKQEAMA